MVADPVAALVAREEIARLLSRRGRAADAKDPEAILAEHVPGSRDEHGVLDGTIEAWVEHLRTHNYADERYGLQRHTVANVLVDLDAPDLARAESLHLAFHRITLADGTYDVWVGGRYLDRCERHDGRWRLASRSVVYDWSRSALATEPLTLEDA